VTAETLTIDAALDDLRSRVTGEVLTAADAGYDAARSGFNVRFQQRPAVLVVPHAAENVAEAVRAAVARGFGTRPIDVPLAGGSLPDAAWTKTLGVPSFLVPYGDPEQANHAPNESYAVGRYRQGIRTSAILLAELAKT